jgi:hypothetical protein
METLGTKKVQNTRSKWLCFVAIALSIFWSLAPLLGWNEYTPEIDQITCSINWSSRSVNVASYNITAFVAIYLIPLTIILITNYKIFSHVSKTQKLANGHLLKWKKDKDLLLIILSNLCNLRRT